MRLAPLCLVSGLAVASGCGAPTKPAAGDRGREVERATAVYAASYAHSVSLERVDAQGWLDSDPRPSGRPDSDSSLLSGSLKLDFEDRFDAAHASHRREIIGADLRYEWSDRREGVVISSGSVQGRGAVSVANKSADAANQPPPGHDPAVLFDGADADGPGWTLTPQAIAFLLGPCGELEFVDVNTNAPCVDLLTTLRRSTRAEVAATRLPSSAADVETFELKGFIEGRVKNAWNDRPDATQEDSMRVELLGRITRARRDPRCVSVELSGELVFDVLSSQATAGPGGAPDRLHVRARSRGPLHIAFTAERR